MKSDTLFFFKTRMDQSRGYSNEQQFVSSREGYFVTISSGLIHENLNVKYHDMIVGMREEGLGDLEVICAIMAQEESEKR